MPDNTPVSKFFEGLRCSLKKATRKLFDMSDARSNSYITLNQRKPFKVVVCAITLVAFLVNTLAYDLAWAGESASSELTSVGSDRAAGPGLFKELNVTTFKIPESLGIIKDSWSSASRSPVNSARTVIHIQDTHCNYYAQTKIVEIVEYLNKEYGIDTINLEGGAMGYDLSPFTDIKDKALRVKASDHFVMEGLVNGAEYFAVNNPEKVTLWGIEDPKLYVDNLRIYRNSVKNKDAIDKYLKSLSYVLSSLKVKIYSKELFDFDLKYSQYKAGSMELKDYLDYLVLKAKERSIDIKKLSDIYLLSQALEEESKIDFEKAGNECDSLIDALQKKLSKRMLEELVVKSVEFKSEKISQKDYYTYLVSKAAVVKVDLQSFPELKRYLSHIAVYEAMNKVNVMDELASLEDMVKDKLYRNDEERELSTLSKNLAILKNIFGINITRQDYEYYKNNEDSFGMRKYISFITDKAPPYGIAANLDKDIKDLDKYRKDMTGFYECSLKRDKAFLNNMRLDKSAMVITGGFHTDNLAELFKNSDISYVSIVPNFRNEDGYECPYYQLLSGEKSPNLRAELPSVLKTTLALKSSLCPGINGEKPILVKSVVSEPAAVPTPAAPAQTAPAPAPDVTPILTVEPLITNDRIEACAKDLLKSVKTEYADGALEALQTGQQNFGWGFFPDNVKSPKNRQLIVDRAIILLNNELGAAKPVKPAAAPAQTSAPTPAPVIPAPKPAAPTSPTTPSAVLGLRPASAPAPAVAASGDEVELEIKDARSIRIHADDLLKIIKEEIRKESKDSPSEVMVSIRTQGQLEDIASDPIMMAYYLKLAGILNPLNYSKVMQRAIDYTKIEIMVKQEKVFNDDITAAKTVASLYMLKTQISQSLGVGSLRKDGADILLAKLEQKKISLMAPPAEAAKFIIWDAPTKVTRNMGDESYSDGMAKAFWTEDRVREFTKTDSNRAISVLSEVFTVNASANPQANIIDLKARLKVGKVASGTLDRLQKMIYDNTGEFMRTVLIMELSISELETKAGIKVEIKAVAAKPVSETAKPAAQAGFGTGTIPIFKSWWSARFRMSYEKTAGPWIEEAIFTLAPIVASIFWVGMIPLASLVFVLAHMFDWNRSTRKFERTTLPGAAAFIAITGLAVSLGTYYLSTIAGFGAAGFVLGGFTAFIAKSIFHTIVNRTSMADSKLAGTLAIALASFMFMVGGQAANPDSAAPEPAAVKAKAVKAEATVEDLGEFLKMEKIASLRSEIEELAKREFSLTTPQRNYLDELVSRLREAIRTPAKNFVTSAPAPGATGHAGFGIRMKDATYANESDVDARRDMLRSQIDKGKTPKGFSRDTVTIDGQRIEFVVNDALWSRLMRRNISLRQYIEECVAARGDEYRTRLLNGLKGKTLILDVLKASPNLYGNCQQDGYIYMNEVVLSEELSGLDTIGISHELMHEAGIMTGAEGDELELARQDRQLIAKANLMEKIREKLAGLVDDSSPLLQEETVRFDKTGRTQPTVAIVTFIEKVVNVVRTSDAATYDALMRAVGWDPARPFDPTNMEFINAVAGYIARSNPQLKAQIMENGRVKAAVITEVLNSLDPFFNDRNETFIDEQIAQQRNIRDMAENAQHPSLGAAYTEVRRIMDDILRAAGYDPSRFNLLLINSPDVNAFAGPGTNYIAVYTGLLEYIRDKNLPQCALAGIIAHELGHIIDSRVTKCWPASERARTSNTAGADIYAGRYAGEYSADLARLKVMDRAGYSITKGYVALFQEFEKDHASGSSLAYLGEHPVDRDRINAIERIRKGQHWDSLDVDRPFTVPVPQPGERRQFYADIEKCGTTNDLMRLIDACKDLADIDMIVSYVQILRTSATFAAMEPRLKAALVKSGYSGAVADVIMIIYQYYLTKDAALLQSVAQRMKSATAAEVEQILALYFDLSKYIIDDRQRYAGYTVNNEFRDYRRWLSKTLKDIATFQFGRWFRPAASAAPPAASINLPQQDVVGFVIESAFSVIRSRNLGPADLLGFLETWLLSLKGRGLKDSDDTSAIYWLHDSLRLLTLSAPIPSSSADYKARWAKVAVQLTKRSKFILENSELDVYREMVQIKSAISGSLSSLSEQLGKLLVDGAMSIEAAGEVNKAMPRMNMRMSIAQALEISSTRIRDGNYLILFNLARQLLPGDDIEILHAIVNKYKISMEEFVRLISASSFMERNPFDPTDYGYEPSSYFDAALKYYDIDPRDMSESLKKVVWNLERMSRNNTGTFTMAELARSGYEGLSRDDAIQLYRYLQPKGGKVETRVLHQIGLNILETANQDGVRLRGFFGKIDNIAYSITRQRYQNDPMFFLMDHLGGITSTRDRLKLLDDDNGASLHTDVAVILDTYFDGYLDSIDALDGRLESILTYLPASPYRNHIIYAYFVYRVMLAWKQSPAGLKSSLTIEGLRDELRGKAPFKAFELAGEMLSEMDALNRPKLSRLYIEQIAPNLYHDTELEEFNAKVLARGFVPRLAERYGVRPSQTEPGRFSADSYMFKEAGGVQSQIDILVSLLFEQEVRDAINDALLSLDAKLSRLQEIMKRPSATRDKYLDMVLASYEVNEKYKISERDIMKVVSLMRNPDLKRRYIVTAFAKRVYEEEPGKDFDYYLDLLVREYMPDFSDARDDIIEDLFQTHGLTPEHAALAYSHMLSNPDNLIKPSARQHVTAEDKLLAYLKELPVGSKEELLLWILGIRVEKPGVIIEEEQRLNADLSGLRDILAAAQIENFRTYGKRRSGRMLDALFYGGEETAGILTDSASFGRISGSLFDHATSGLSKKQKDGFRHIWNAVLDAADQDKRRDIYANLIAAIAGKQGAVSYADLTRIFLESCGIVGVKMGQYLSMSGELLGLDIELKDALNSLTDKAKPLSRLTAMRIMSADLDKEHSVRRLMPEKLEKSASIKVTALAEMADGTVRVVKVKRPEAAQELEKEKRFLAKAFENLRASGFLDNVALPQNVIDILGAMLTQEVDFTHEAQAQKELTENLNRRSKGVFVRAYRFMKGLAGKRVTVKIPNSTWVSRSGNIMLEEFARGKGLEKDSSLRFEIASELMKQLFIDGVYHADAHAGNILVDADTGTIYFIDLGCTGRIGDKNRRALWGLFKSVSGKVNADGIIKFIDSIVTISDDQRSALRDKIRTDIVGKNLGPATAMAMVFVLMDSMKIKYSDEFGYVFKFFLSSSYIFDSLPKKKQISIFASIESRMRFGAAAEWFRAKPAVPTSSITPQAPTPGAGSALAQSVTVKPSKTAVVSVPWSKREKIFAASLVFGMLLFVALMVMDIFSESLAGRGGRTRGDKGALPQAMTHKADDRKKAGVSSGILRSSQKRESAPILRTFEINLPASNMSNMFDEMNIEPGNDQFQETRPLTAEEDANNKANILEWTGTFWSSENPEEEPPGAAILLSLMEQDKGLDPKTNWLQKYLQGDKDIGEDTSRWVQEAAKEALRYMLYLGLSPENGDLERSLWAVLEAQRDSNPPSDRAIFDALIARALEKSADPEYIRRIVEGIQYGSCPGYEWLYGGMNNKFPGQKDAHYIHVELGKKSFESLPTTPDGWKTLIDGLLQEKPADWGQETTETQTPAVTGSWNPKSDWWTRNAYLTETGMSLAAGFVSAFLLKILGFDSVSPYIVSGASALTFFIGMHAFKAEARKNMFTPTVIGLGIGTAIVSALLVSGNPVIAGLGVLAAVLLGGIHYVINNAVINRLNRYDRVLRNLIGSDRLIVYPDVYSPFDDGGDALKFAADVKNNMEDPKEGVISRIKNSGRNSMRILVIGTGTGVDAMTAYRAAKEAGMDVELDGIDINQKAVDVTEANFNKLFGKDPAGVKIRAVTETEEFTGIGKDYDMVIWNASVPAAGMFPGYKHGKGSFMDIDVFSSIRKRVPMRMRMDNDRTNCVFMLRAPLWLRFPAEAGDLLDDAHKRMVLLPESEGFEWDHIPGTAKPADRVTFIGNFKPTVEMRKLAASLSFVAPKKEPSPALVAKTDDGVIQFAAFNDGSNRPGYSKDRSIDGSDTTIIRVNTGGAVLYSPKPGEIFSIITPAITNCTGIYIRTKDASGRVYYGLAHVLIKSKYDGSLSDHVNYVKGELAQKGFVIEDMFVDYCPANYGKTGGETDIPGIFLKPRPANPRVNSVGFPELTAEGVIMRRTGVAEEPEIVRIRRLAPEDLWKWGEAAPGVAPAPGAVSEEKWLQDRNNTIQRYLTKVRDVLVNTSVKTDTINDIERNSFLQYIVSGVESTNEPLKRQRILCEQVALAAREAAGHPQDQFGVVIYPSSGTDMMAAAAYSDNIVTIDRSDIFAPAKDYGPDELVSKIRAAIEYRLQHGMQSGVGENDLVCYLVDLYLTGADLSSLKVLNGKPREGWVIPSGEIDPVQKDVSIVTVQFNLEDGRTIQHTHIPYHLREDISSEDGVREVAETDSFVKDRLLSLIARASNPIVLSKASALEPGSSHQSVTSLYTIMPAGTVVVSDEDLPSIGNALPGGILENIKSRDILDKLRKLKGRMPGSENIDASDDGVIVGYSPSDYLKYGYCGPEKINIVRVTVHHDLPETAPTPAVATPASEVAPIGPSPNAVTVPVAAPAPVVAAVPVAAPAAQGAANPFGRILFNPLLPAVMRDSMLKNEGTIAAGPNGEFSVTVEMDKYGVTSSPINDIDYEFTRGPKTALFAAAGSFYGEIVKMALAKKARNERLYILDWGAGDLTGAKTLIDKLAEDGIDNVYIVAFSKGLYKGAKEVVDDLRYHDKIALIIDVAENLAKDVRMFYPQLNEFGIIYSNQGLRYIAELAIQNTTVPTGKDRFLSHMADLSGLLAPDGFLISDLFNAEAIAMCRELQPDLAKLTNRYISIVDTNSGVNNIGYLYIPPASAEPVMPYSATDIGRMRELGKKFDEAVDMAKIRDWNRLEGDERLKAIDRLKTFSDEIVEILREVPEKDRPNSALDDFYNRFRGTTPSAPGTRLDIPGKLFGLINSTDPSVIKGMGPEGVKEIEDEVLATLIEAQRRINDKLSQYPSAATAPAPVSTAVPEAGAVDPRGLEEYLSGQIGEIQDEQNRQKHAGDIEKVRKVFSKETVLLEIGCGRAGVSLALAKAHPEIGILATDSYAPLNGDREYFENARNWEEGGLEAQKDAAGLDNLAIVRARLNGILENVPDGSLDYILMVNLEFVLVSIALGMDDVLFRKLKTGGKIIIKPSTPWELHHGWVENNYSNSNYKFERIDGTKFLGIDLHDNSQFSKGEYPKMQVVITKTGILAEKAAAAAPAEMQIDTVVSRQANMTAAGAAVNMRDADVELHTGIPTGALTDMTVSGVTPILTSVSRALEKNGYGPYDAKKDLKTFEMPMKADGTIDQDKVEDNIVNNIDKDMNPDKILVIAVPSIKGVCAIDTSPGSRFEQRCREKHQKTVLVPDAYSDSVLNPVVREAIATGRMNKAYADIGSRMMLARIVAWMYLSPGDTDAAKAFREYIFKLEGFERGELVNLNDLPEILRKLNEFAIRIMPIDYTDIDEFRNSQIATAVSA